MRGLVFRVAVFGLLASVLIAPRTQAAIVIIDQLIQADFTFAATAEGEAFFGAPEGVPLPMRALGLMTFALDDDGTSSTIPFTNATGQLNGVSPPTSPGFLPFFITPVRFDGGTLTNVVRDGSGRITSGTVVDLAMPWEMIGTGANSGIVLYGDQATTPLLFGGDVDVVYDGAGVPSIAFGDFISGSAPFNVYRHISGDRANQIPGSDPLVFVGTDRFLTAVPEPSSLLVGCFALGVLVRRKRHS